MRQARCLYGAANWLKTNFSKCSKIVKNYLMHCVFFVVLFFIWTSWSEIKQIKYHEKIFIKVVLLCIEFA